MRRIIAGAGLLCCGLLLVAVSSDNQAAAAPRKAVSAVEMFGASDGLSALAAGHIEGFFCGLGPGGVSTDSRVTISQSGNATLVCRNQTPTGPDQALVIKDGLCGVPLDRPPFFAVTSDLQLVWTPSGQATLVCRVKG